MVRKGERLRVTKEDKRWIKGAIEIAAQRLAQRNEKRKPTVNDIYEISEEQEKGLSRKQIISIVGNIKKEAVLAS